MTLLTYIESENGKIKKAGLEVASYGKALADQLNYTTVALVFGVDDATVLHNYGIEKILNVKSSISFEAGILVAYIQIIIKKVSITMHIAGFNIKLFIIGPLFFCIFFNSVVKFILVNKFGGIYNDS